MQNGRVALFDKKGVVIVKTVVGTSFNDNH